MMRKGKEIRKLVQLLGNVCSLKERFDYGQWEEEE